MNNYKTLAIVGSQWGDEGKGKLVDYYATNADMVVRWAGGDNAGHTIVFDNKKYKLSAIPSGVFNKNTVNVIAAGCVINLEKIISEINYLKENGFENFKLFISNRCHIILPHHIQLDGIEEELKASSKIGTTKRGIGPTYEERARRSGLRIGDLFDSDNARKILYKAVADANFLIEQKYNMRSVQVDLVYEKLMEQFAIIKPYVTETSSLVRDYISRNKFVLFEGAQGVLLDIVWGSYPYVTSSHPLPNSIPVDVGIPNRMLNKTMGVVKAYTTRVGNGGFVSELSDNLANIIRERGREYGTVSGRARRIGWLDLVLLKHSLDLVGYDFLAITLLDVLSTIGNLKICYKYVLDGKEIDYFPATNHELERCKPVYLEMPGWSEDISNCTTYDSLPWNAKKYLEKIEELLGTEIALISLGPDRNQTILRKKITF